MRRGRTRWWLWGCLALLVVAAVALWLDRLPFTPVLGYTWVRELDATKLYKHGLRLRPQGGAYATAYGKGVYSLGPKGDDMGHFLPQGTHRIQGQAVDAQGHLYIGCGQDGVYALDEKCDVLWRAQIPQRSTPAAQPRVLSVWPVVGSDGDVYVATSAGNIAVLSPDGRLLHSAALNQRITSCFAAAPDGTLYGTVDTRTIVAFTEKGITWTRVFPSLLISRGVGPGGEICIGVPEDKFYVLNADGSVRWTWANPDSATYQRGTYRPSYEFALAPGNRIVVASEKWLCSFEADGTKAWEIRLPAELWQMVCARDGSAYCTVYRASVTAPLGQALRSVARKTGVDSWLGSPLAILEGEKELLIKISPDGKVLRQWELPRRCRHLVGPGPEGELYGYDFEVHGAPLNSANWTSRVFRIDPPE